MEQDKVMVKRHISVGASCSGLQPCTLGYEGHDLGPN
jgi:hypothetical protein